MAYVCLDCYEIYNGDNLYKDEFSDYQCCPKTNCIGQVIEIDELLIPVIIELNKKGYSTKYCCSGHYYGQHPNGYIMFEKDVIIPSIPKGFIYEKTGNTIRSTLDHRVGDNKNYDNDCFKIYKNAEILLKWAKSLPNYDEE